MEIHRFDYWKLTGIDQCQGKQLAHASSNVIFWDSSKSKIAFEHRMLKTKRETAPEHCLYSRVRILI